MLKHTFNVVLPLVLLRLLLICAPCRGQSSVVWQIGKFNDSSLEFRQGAPKQDPVFVVGQSDPAKDWYADQPGRGVGGRAHPFTVRFGLPQAPSGLYTRSSRCWPFPTPRFDPAAGAGGEHKRPPGWFFQHPVLNYTGDDPGYFFIPTFSADSITFDIPTRFLRQGDNTLVLEAVAEPVGGDLQITYDALALEHDAAQTYAAKAIREVLPTIFYKSRGPGLAELVDVFLRYGEAPLRGEVGAGLQPARPGFGARHGVRGAEAEL